jgi:PAS domain S-box-containing protein
VRLYVLVVGVVGSAALLLWILGSVFGVTNECITFYPAIAVAALVGGARAGLMATVLSAVAMEVLFMEPQGSMMWGRPGEWVELVLFTSAGGLIIWMAAKVDRAHKQEAEALARKRGEEAVHTVSLELQQALETSATGITHCSRDLRYLSANPAIAKLTGVPLERIVGRPIAEVLGAEALEVVRPYVERVLRGERVVFETEVPYAVTGRKWMHVAYAPEEDAAGNVTGWVASVTDITEWKRAENALRASESTLRSFYESAPLMLGVVEVPADNSDIMHVYDNPATDRFFGRSRGDTAGQSARGMGAPEEVVTRWIENYRLAERQGKPVQFEYWHPLNRGGVWLSAAVAKIGPGDAGRTRFSYAVADVTERKRVDEALRASEERLTLATLGGDLGIWDWDISRDMVHLSGKYYEMTGYQEGEVQPNMEFFLGLVHPEDRPTLERTRAAHLRGESDYSVTEYRLRRKTGEYRWVRGVGKVVARDEQGAPLRMAGVTADITVQKKAEEALREQLAHASRVSTMGELASSITHQLGQPLGAIHCNVDAAELSLNQTPPALSELRDILNDIRKEDQRAGEVIQSMRKLLLRHDIEPQPLEINLLAEEVLRLVKEDAVSRGMRITTELSPQLPAVPGNRVQLQQVVLNFIMNAMDAMAQQPPERRRLTVGTSLATDGAVQLSVSDLGPGIEARNLPRLFQPFFTTKPGGLGIGLSVSERIVTAHRGHVWAENRPTGGAVFHMALPAVNGQA